MRVLVTGGSGFIGTNLVSYLRSQGDHVVNYDVNPPRSSDDIECWQRGDVRDGPRFRDVVRDFGPDACVHLAARTDLMGSSLVDYSSNVLGVKTVAEVLNDAAPDAFAIYASSRLVCRIGYSPQSSIDYCPPNAYGESKVVGEGLVREIASHDFLIVRPTSIWGPWFGVPYRDFFDAVLGGRFPLLRGVSVEKSFGYVGNSVVQIGLLLRNRGLPEADMTYLADYPAIEVNEFARSIRKMAGMRVPIAVPHHALRPVAKIGDVMERMGWQNAPLTTFRLGNLLTPMLHDLEALRAVCGELPFSVEDGISQTLKWMSDQEGDV